MYERTYKIKITDPNRIVTIRGKEVRTPVEATVSESELNIVRSTLIASGCRSFQVEKAGESFLYDFPEVYNRETITPLEKKVVTTYDEVKARILSEKKVANFKVNRIKSRKPLGPIIQKIPTTPTETSFYIPLELQANKTSFLDEVPIKKQDFEVKIEDLKVSSDSILKKLLKETTK